jgi:hypothetical protein
MGAAFESNGLPEIKQFRLSRLSDIMLDMQRHIITVDDRETSEKRRYSVETVFNNREGYCYTVTWKLAWETTEQAICSGARFETADAAFSSALLKIEAWERWLEARNPNSH